MKSILALPSQPWLGNPASKKIMDLFNHEGGEPQALFVGGCVRNGVLGEPVEDIDIATKHLPDAVMEILQNAGVKVIPTGIDHGTVTAVIEECHFEITTLRYDAETDGRHAKVGYTDSWIEDAKRRDFTMNTLLADIEGNVFDPLGCGVDDTKQKRVVFVGEPASRIAEDYLRILRLFRFHAFYGEGDVDRDALRACQEAADKIGTLSRERITQEFLKILSVDNPTDIINRMFEHGVLNELAGKNYTPKIMLRFCELQKQHDAVNVLARLFVLSGCQPSTFEARLRLSHQQKNFIIKLLVASSACLFDDERALKKAIYHHGNDLMTQGYLLSVAMGSTSHDSQMVEFAQNWKAPKCPVTGDSLITEGYVTGPDLGQELKRREAEWLDEVL